MKSLVDKIARPTPTAALALAAGAICTIGDPGTAMAQTSTLGTTIRVAELQDCPARGSDVTQQLDCLCMPPFGKGSRVGVEGSGPYSWYSNICLSAVHAGAIGRDGGAVRIVPRPPQSKYVGTLANDVYSTDFGSSKKGSFDVEPLSGQ